MTNSLYTLLIGLAINFALYVLDVLFVLDIMDISITDNDSECGNPLISSPKMPYRGLSLSI